MEAAKSLKVISGCLYSKGDWIYSQDT